MCGRGILNSITILISDEKVIKVMLPMVAIAVLACVVGYYIKNKFFKDDEGHLKLKDIGY